MSKSEIKYHGASPECEQCTCDIWNMADSVDFIMFIKKSQNGVRDGGIDTLAQPVIDESMYL